MGLNFFEILIKPFKYKNIFQRIFTAFTLFLPFIIALKILEVSGFWLIVLFGVAVIDIIGYLWVIFHSEIREKSDALPEWQIVKCFFIGIKGLFFILGFIALYVITVMTIWLLVHFVPAFKTPALIMTGLLSVYWFFFLFASASALFAGDLQFGDSLNFSKITQLAEGCWTDYLKALFFLGLYVIIAFIISVLIFSFINLFYPPLARIGALSFLGLYSIMACIILYARVYNVISDKFENYI